MEHTVNWFGTEAPAGEIGPVETDEKFRKKGFSTSLMDQFVDLMRSKNIPISFPWGIPGFYEQFHHYYGYPNYSTAYTSYQFHYVRLQRTWDAFTPDFASGVEREGVPPTSYRAPSSFCKWTWYKAK